MITHLLRYQGFAVDDYGFTLDALNLGYLSFRLTEVIIIELFKAADTGRSPFLA
jgi:hypothetical protein